MAKIFMEVGGSPTFSAQLTATKANVMNNKTAVTSDSNDVYAQGSLPITHVLPSSGGTIAVNYLDTFSAVQSVSVYRGVQFNFTITARAGKPFSGIYVRGKFGSYPTSMSDGIDLGYHSATGSTATFTAEQLTETGEWYFRAWPFYRYNQRGDTTYDSIEYSTTYHEAHCNMTYYSNPVYITTSQTWTVPLGVNSVQVCCVGGGGGGFNRRTGTSEAKSGGCAGGGGYVVIDTVQVTPQSEIAITVGAGGQHGYYDNDGVKHIFSGSPTSFGNYITANGGGGGTGYGSSSQSNGGNGGCGGAGGGSQYVVIYGECYASPDGGREGVNDRCGYSGYYKSGDALIMSGKSGYGQATTTIFDSVGYGGGGAGGTYYNGDQTTYPISGDAYQGGGRKSKGINGTGGGGAGGQGNTGAYTGYAGGSGICIIKW